MIRKKTKEAIFCFFLFTQSTQQVCKPTRCAKTTKYHNVNNKQSAHKMYDNEPGVNDSSYTYRYLASVITFIVTSIYNILTNLAVCEI